MQARAWERATLCLPGAGEARPCMVGSRARHNGERDPSTETRWKRGWSAACPPGIASPLPSLSLRDAIEDERPEGTPPDMRAGLLRGSDASATARLLLPRHPRPGRPRGDLSRREDATHERGSDPRGSGRAPGAGSSSSSSSGRGCHLRSTHTWAQHARANATPQARDRSRRVG